ncbi:MAG: Holliday junction branch migration protein RuvA [Flavobacteriales bacterium]|nr:Holliday junction branch migration protein RuvA [Bacteroidales bacterium AH-315-I05]PCJ82869.1 MAG: Holliday junction branch migration protein RuvA [Flavobacteriales bacterium]
MIEHLQGRLIEKHPTHAVIECNGVGYRVSISLNTYSKLPDKESCKLLVHYAVSVDVRSGTSVHALYGFVEESERELFRLLIGISGVSAATANLILSGLSPGEVQSAVLNDNMTLFKSVKGIGPKLAQKIIVEMKSKLLKSELSSEISSFPHNTTRQEALSALAALGFDKISAQRALKKVVEMNGEEPIEEMVKAALKHLA